MDFISIEPLVLRHLALCQMENENRNQEEILHNSPKNKEFTTARQVLAMTFLLKRCGINPIDNPTPVAKLIQFLTNREANAKRIQNTTIYKLVTKPFRENETTLLKDLHFIRNYFQDIGIPEIVVDIDREIAQSEKSG